MEVNRWAGWWQKDRRRCGGLVEVEVIDHVAKDFGVFA